MGLIRIVKKSLKISKG